MQENQFRKVLPMILLVIPFVYLIFGSPFREPVQTIIEFLYLALILGLTILDSIKTWRNADEVQIAAASFSVSTGAILGLACTVAFVIFMTHVPTVANFIASIADLSKNKLPPAAAGFGLGALAALILVLVCGHTAYAIREWRTSHR